MRKILFLFLAVLALLSIANAPKSYAATIKECSQALTIGPVTETSGTYYLTVPFKDSADYPTQGGRLKYYHVLANSADNIKYTILNNTTTQQLFPENVHNNLLPLIPMPQGSYTIYFTTENQELCSATNVFTFTINTDTGAGTLIHGAPCTDSSQCSNGDACVNTPSVGSITSGSNKICSKNNPACGTKDTVPMNCPWVCPLSTYTKVGESTTYYCGDSSKIPLCGENPAPPPAQTSDNTSANSIVPSGQYGCTVMLDKSKAPPDQCADGGTCVPIQPYSILDFGKKIITNGFCIPKPAECAKCPDGYDFVPSHAVCENSVQSGDYKPLTIECCSKDQVCSPGYGCGKDITSKPLSTCPNGSCDTALGPLPTDLPALLTRVFSIVLTIAGIVALSLIIASGYRLMVSQGNPEQVKGAREQLTAAIIGLLFIIFSLVILQVIGGNILKIPGFGA